MVSTSVRDSRPVQGGIGQRLCDGGHLVEGPPVVFVDAAKGFCLILREAGRLVGELLEEVVEDSHDRGLVRLGLEEFVERIRVDATNASLTAVNSRMTVPSPKGNQVLMIIHKYLRQ